MPASVSGGIAPSKVPYWSRQSLFVAIFFVIAFRLGFPAAAEDLTLRTPPVKMSIPIEGQSVTVTAFAVVSGKSDLFHWKLTADLSELQERATDLVQAQLNRSDRCGERLSVERATLVPEPPASILTVYLHYERWVCIKALGKSSAKRLLGGNGVIPVKLTPTLAEDATVKLMPEVGRIEADGSLGEVLRSPSIADKVRDKVSDSILSALQRGTTPGAALPPAIAKIASIRSVEFTAGDAAGLLLEIDGDVRIPASEIKALIDERKSR